MDKYNFGYQHKVGGKEMGTVVTLDPTPVMDKYAKISYFRMTVDLGDITTVLPLQEDQIVLVEQAIADFRRGVVALAQG